jgi:multidrug efflux pump subunit AcrA (membrane-fusion protein)
MLRAARGSVAIALVASGVVACATTTAPPRPNTVPVQRTSITSGVSAAGALTAVTEQNIGFTKGGQLTAVNVKVGDHVTAGEVLATIDPFPARQALDQARGQLTTQQATLNKVQDSPAVSNARTAPWVAPGSGDAAR